MAAIYSLEQWVRLVGLAAGPAVDTVRPAAVLSAGSWTAFPSGTIAANVADADDATGARSSTGAATDTLDLSFPAMATPPAGTITFYVRHRRTP